MVDRNAATISTPIHMALLKLTGVSKMTRGAASPPPKQFYWPRRGQSIFHSDVSYRPGYASSISGAASQSILYLQTPPDQPDYNATFSRTQTVGFDTAILLRGNPQHTSSWPRQPCVFAIPPQSLVRSTPQARKLQASITARIPVRTRKTVTWWANSQTHER